MLSGPLAQIKHTCGQGLWPSPENVLIPLTTEFTSQVKRNEKQTKMERFCECIWML